MQAQINMDALVQQVEAIRLRMLKEEKRYKKYIEPLHANHKRSACNLIHYLALRSFDLRQIQEELSALGLSSVGHSERYTYTNITNILHMLYLLQGKTKPDLEEAGLPFALKYPGSKHQLLLNTDMLLGPEKYPDHTRMMITMPSEASSDPGFMVSLLEAGMDVVRINTAHDNEEVWKAMIANLRKAEKETGKKALIYMDLAGPKLRTGPIAPIISGKGKVKDGFIFLKPGDKLEIFRYPILGQPARLNERVEQIEPARISLSLGSVLEDLQVGHSIWFDDGKIGGVIESISPDIITVNIIQADPQGSKLREEKGVNLPDSCLKMPPLTDEDLAVLPFIAKNADMVGYSFVRKPSDVTFLQDQLQQLGKSDLGIILKIETKETFDNLPGLLLHAMRSPKVGVMIARGDLAVEVGWTRIAEVQEQISWICEAAHIPIIWATQVLDNLVRKGIATRAEITDAAMAVRAECAMLNKGPFIIDAMKTLHNIDVRMMAHHHKKMGALRPLNVAAHFLQKTRKAVKEVVQKNPPELEPTNVLP